MAKTIFLSIWHDWWKWDQWAVGNWTTEAIEAKKIVDGVIAKGVPWIKLVKVPEWLTLVQRIDWINKQILLAPEPFALEFHLDSWPKTARWASVWYCGGNEYTPIEWKQFLATFTRVTGEPSRHVNPDTADRLGRLGFVRDVKCAALLVELWFISNTKDLETIRTKAIEWVRAGIFEMNK